MQEIEKMLKEIEQLVADDQQVIMNAEPFENLHRLYDTVDDAAKAMIVENIYGLLGSGNVYKAVYLYTYLIHITRDNRYVTELIDFICDNKTLSKESRFFLYNQIKSMNFHGKYDFDITSKTKLYQFFCSIVNEYKQELGAHLRPVMQQSERNENLVLVITEQMLEIEHGPTKSALGRCIALKNMGKQVMLINTAELMSRTGGFSIYRGRIANYNPDYLKCSELTWKGTTIPFFQCDNNMPNVEVLEYLINVVKELKPYYVVAIGGDGIFVSLISEIVPTLAVSMIPSSIRITACDYQTLGRPVNEEDRRYLKAIGRDESRIIEHKFTSDLVEQKGKLSKQDLGIAEDSFTISIVGGRLDSEITEEFLDTLEKLIAADDKLVYIIMGNYGKMKQIEKERTNLFRHIKYLGTVNDILAYYEACDLYMNPVRVGGGTSCVEAMSKGIPVVTTDYGDVAINAGSEFFTKDYASMQELVLRYKNDREFYQENSQKAKERAEELLDTTKAFGELVTEFMQREEREFVSEKKGDFLREIYCDCEYQLWNAEDCKCLKEREIKASENPMFSFMMCTYNDTSVLNASINSLLMQECDDWELVILDNSDKSDEPWKLIQNAMEADPRIRGFRSDKNCGWPKGASECMKHIKGKYTTFLAADDCINKGALKYMHQLLEEKQPDILWVSAASTIYNGNEDVRINGMIENRYQEFDGTSHSDNIVQIMSGTYYNSFFHYLKVDFLRAHQIDFFEPYYADWGGMTKALAEADSMITTNQLVYFLTDNTSQTKGKYTWGSFGFMFARQWETVRVVFVRENYSQGDNISYVAQRILNNVIGNARHMLSNHCRNKYMNPVEKTTAEIAGELEGMLENRGMQEMLVLAGNGMRKHMYETICPYIVSAEYTELLADKPMLNQLKNLAIAVRNGDIQDRISNIISFLMLDENKVFMGFDYFAEILEQCSDDVIIAYQAEIQAVIDGYTQFLDIRGKDAGDVWYAGLLQ